MLCMTETNKNHRNNVIFGHIIFHNACVSFDLILFPFDGIVQQLSVHLVRKCKKVLLVAKVFQFGDLLIIFQEFSDGLFEEFILEDMLLYLRIKIPLFSPVRPNQD